MPPPKNLELHPDFCPVQAQDNAAHPSRLTGFSLTTVLEEPLLVSIPAHPDPLPTQITYD